MSSGSSFEHLDRPNFDNVSTIFRNLCRDKFPLDFLATKCSNEYEHILATSLFEHFLIIIGISIDDSSTNSNIIESSSSSNIKELEPSTFETIVSIKQPPPLPVPPPESWPAKITVSSILINESYNTETAINIRNSTTDSLNPHFTVTDDNVNRQKAVHEGKSTETVIKVGMSTSKRSDIDIKSSSVGPPLSLDLNDTQTHLNTDETVGHQLQMARILRIKLKRQRKRSREKAERDELRRQGIVKKGRNFGKSWRERGNRRKAMGLHLGPSIPKRPKL